MPTSAKEPLAQELQKSCETARPLIATLVCFCSFSRGQSCRPDGLNGMSVCSLSMDRVEHRALVLSLHLVMPGCAQYLICAHCLKSARH